MSTFRNTMITQIPQKLRAQIMPMPTNKENGANFLFKELTYKIIGIAMQIHKKLGPGFLEAVYEEVLLIEFAKNNVSFENQVPLDICYNGIKLRKKYRADFIIENKILLEIKKVSNLTKIDEMQMINYLRVTKLKVGLVLNFGRTSLQWKRIIC